MGLYSLDRSGRISVMIDLEPCAAPWWTFSAVIAVKDFVHLR